MIGPVGHRGLDFLKARQFAGEKVAERKARGVQVFAVAVEEVHRHIERVVDVALEAHAVFEHERQHAGARVVDVGPYVAAVGQEPVRAALAERRRREHRGRDRLQRQADAELLDHVGFGGEVEVHLDRAGAEHHFETEAADARHVALHDAVAALRHHRHVFKARGRVVAEADEACADFLGDLAHLIEMFVRLGAGFVDAPEWRAGELQLATGFQADCGAGGVLQADDVRAFVDRLPAAEAPQAFEHRADARLPLIRERRQRFQVVAELFVLGADAPFALRLHPLGDEVDEVGFGCDRAAASLRNGHEGTSMTITPCRRAPVRRARGEALTPVAERRLPQRDRGE